VRRIAGGLALAAALVATGRLAGASAVELVVEPREATVGDPLTARLVLDLPAGSAVQAQPLPERLGPFHVSEQRWSGPEAVEGGGVRWSWTARLAAFRTGELEVPAIQVEVSHGDGQRETFETAPLTVRIGSVLEPADPEAATAPEIADLKAPASLAPNYTTLTVAGGIVALLALLAGLIWWLGRRYGAALAAVPSPQDPFDRTPPHVWIYGELQRLLARRLAEAGHVDLFFAELARIVKLYLGGRYRVELMERTTEEVPRLLRQAGADERALAASGALLAQCDRVKFAGDRPDPTTCRRAIEEAYAIVDATKPREEARSEERGAA
jgi:hypothetical protein